MTVVETSVQVSSLATDIEDMFEWKNECSVNIKSIDAQHRHLFAIAAELRDAMHAGQAKPALGKILDRLVQYTLVHFAHEEKLMQQHGYPDLPAHHVEHEALKKQVQDFQKQFHSGQAMISVALMNFLKDWLEKHIKGTDIRYSPFLIERKVA